MTYRSVWEGEVQMREKVFPSLYTWICGSAKEWASPVPPLSTSRGQRRAESGGARSPKPPAPQPPSLARGRLLYANLGTAPRTVCKFITRQGISSEQTDSAKCVLPRKHDCMNVINNALLLIYGVSWCLKQKSNCAHEMAQREEK